MVAVHQHHHACMKIVLFTMFLSGLLSCGVQGTGKPNTISSTSQQQYLLQWLRGRECTLPCWSGVTPGLTNADNALGTLQQNKAVNARKQEIVQAPFIGSVLWELPDTPLGGNARYDPRTADKIITYITITGDYALSLESLTDALGKPDYIYVNKSMEAPSDAPLYGIILVFSHQGLVAFGSYPHEPTIDNQTIFTTIAVFPTASGGLTGAFSGASWVHELLEWKDGQSFQDYCRLQRTDCSAIHPQNSYGPSFQDYCRLQRTDCSALHPRNR